MLRNIFYERNNDTQMGHFCVIGSGSRKTPWGVPGGSTPLEIPLHLGMLRRGPKNLEACRRRSSHPTGVRRPAPPELLAPLRRPPLCI